MSEKRLVGKNTPWLRKDGEPGAAYALFCRYKDMGEGRTIGRLAKDLGLKSSRKLTELAQRWQWVHRADQYDGWLAQQRAREASRSAVIQAREEVRAVGYLARAARIAAKDMLVRIKAAKRAGKPLGLTPRVVVELVSESTRLARLVRGEATEVTAVAGARERLADKIERMAEAFRRAEARRDIPNT